MRAQVSQARTWPRAPDAGCACGRSRWMTTASYGDEQRRSRRRGTRPGASPRPRRRRSSRGTTGPTRTRASDEPVGTIPDAIPSLRGSNHAAIKAMDGPRTMAVPAPVRKRATEAAARPLASPVPNIASGREEQPDRHDDAGTEARGEDAADQRHERVAHLVPGGERAGLGAAESPSAFCMEGRMAL